MHWTRLIPIAPEDWFGAKRRKAAEELNAKIGLLVDGRREFEVYLARAEGEDLAKFDFDNAIVVPGHRSALVGLWQKELQLRQELAVFYGDDFALEHGEARNRAIEAHRQAQEEIREKLVGIGYHDFQRSTPDPHRLFPGWIAGHPKVFELRQRLDRFRLEAALGEAKSANERAIKQVKGLLERVRRQALAT